MKKFLILTLVLVSLLAFSAVYVENGKVVFTFKEALDAKIVYLAGNFNNWNPTELSMKKEDGVWKLALELKPGTYQYKYVIEGTNWKEDPEAPGFVDDGFGGYNGIFTLVEKDGKLIIIGTGEKEIKAKEKTIEINENFNPENFFVDEE